MTTKQAHDALLAAMRSAFRLIEDGESKKAARLVPDAMAALRQLDLHLTGKDDCRSQDEPRIARLLTEGETFYVRLSDGEYSRLNLDLFAALSVGIGPAIIINRSLSRAQVITAWDAMTATAGARWSAEDYRRKVGSGSEQDDLDRVNCSEAGAVGHVQCGRCPHDWPRFLHCPICHSAKATP
jgi:hypothetical protein